MQYVCLRFKNAVSPVKGCAVRKAADNDNIGNVAILPQSKMHSDTPSVYILTLVYVNDNEVLPTPVGRLLHLFLRLVAYVVAGIFCLGMLCTMYVYAAVLLSRQLFQRNTPSTKEAVRSGQ